MTPSSILVIIVATLIALTLISAMVGITLMAARNSSLHHAASAFESVAGKSNNVHNISNTSRHPELPARVEVTTMAQEKHAKTSPVVSKNNMKQQTLSTPLRNTKPPAKVEVTTMPRVKHAKTSPSFVSENNMKQQTLSTPKSTLISSKRTAFILWKYIGYNSHIKAM
jgi:hypothetical protein